MSYPQSIMETQERKRMINFDNIINEESISQLTDEQADALLAILEKAGY